MRAIILGGVLMLSGCVVAPIDAGPVGLRAAAPILPQQHDIWPVGPVHEVTMLDLRAQPASAVSDAARARFLRAHRRGAGICKAGGDAARLGVCVSGKVRSFLIRRVLHSPHPSHAFGAGPFPLPQAGEGEFLTGYLAKSEDMLAKALNSRALPKGS